jgi:hypothetical protein
LPWPLILGVVAALAVVALTVHLLLTWFDRRGWVYYRNPNAPKGSSIGLLEEIYQPSMTHVIDEETRQASEADQPDSGGPEIPGK